MKYEEIISLIRSSPSDQNVAVALDWLSRKKRCTKSVQRVLETLLVFRQDAQTLNSIGQWSRDKSWESLCWAAHNLETVKIHDWLVEFANENSENEEVDKLWRALLIRYKDRSVSRGSTSWLVEHPKGNGAATIAEMLLGRTTSDEVKSIARELVLECPDEFFLARVIEYAGNEEIKKLGRKSLETCDPHIGSFLAVALLKADPDGEWPTIEEWLKLHSKNRNAFFLLQDILRAAPIKAARSVFEWLDRHPRFDDYVTSLHIPLILSPSQEYLDLLWSWGKSRVTGRQAAKILELMVYPIESLRIPEEALNIADSWVRNNLDSIESRPILLGLMRIRPTAEKLELARQWLIKHSGVDQGKMFIGLSRLPEQVIFKHQALAWVTDHPNEIASQSILLEYIEKDSDPATIKSAKALLNSRYADTDRILIKLIKSNDEDGIRLAKERLTQRTLEFRHRMSAKHAGAPLIVALLEVLPQDKDVIDIAQDWLQSQDNCEFEDNTCVHISQVRAAYDALFDRG